MTTPLIEALQAALGTQYTLERELGRGGMATVFLATDTKHGRQVALKVLHADLAASLGPERFRREIGFAATLSAAWLRIDPNFAPLRGNPRFERLIASAPPAS